MVGACPSFLNQFVTQLRRKRKIGEMVAVQMPELDLTEPELDAAEPM